MEQTLLKVLRDKHKFAEVFSAYCCPCDDSVCQGIHEAKEYYVQHDATIWDIMEGVYIKRRKERWAEFFRGKTREYLGETAKDSQGGYEAECAAECLQALDSKKVSYWEIFGTPDPKETGCVSEIDEEDRPLMTDDQLELCRKFEKELIGE